MREILPDAVNWMQVNMLSPSGRIPAIFPQRNIVSERDHIFPAQHSEREQNRTEQNRTEQNRTEQNRTEQNTAEQSGTEQN